MSSSSPPPVQPGRTLNLSQKIHILQLALGGLAAALAFLNYMQAAGVVAIVITTTGAIGAYVGGS